SARAVSEFGTIMSSSAYSGATFEEISEGLNGGPRWFQIYMAKDDQQNRDILDEAKSDGATAIILTADSTVSGNRDRDLKNKFVYPFGMPIVQRYLRGSAEGMSLNNIYGASKQKISPRDIEKSPLILDYQYSLKVFNTQKMQIWQSKLVHQVSGYLTTELVNYM